MIPFSKEELLTYFEYHDGNLYWKVSPNPRAKVGTIAGTINRKGYRDIRLQKKPFYAHRAIFFIHHGYVPDQVDHINGIPADNHIENLRPASISENGYNRIKRHGTVADAKNITWCKKDRRWIVRVNVDKQTIRVGAFTSLDDAKTAAFTARKQHHGAFARHT